MSLIVLVAMSVSVAVFAPVLAKISHIRQRFPQTRRSMVLATIAYECLAAAGLCFVTAVVTSNHVVNHITAPAGAFLFAASLYLNSIAFARLARDRRAQRTGEVNDPDL
ncbi:MAG TPA: hypothetical protein VGR57_18060 [Ktedonobacterales bacterium]|nr:hypothetical protein [Ktedonobacterales bacterium]